MGLKGGPGGDSQIRIGALNRSGHLNYWAGLIDDVRIYNRVVRP